jgi:hypothetical protein
MNKLKEEIQRLKENKPNIDAFRAIKSTDTIKLIFKESIEPTIQSVMDTLAEFEELFIDKKLWLGDGNSAVSIASHPDIMRTFDLNNMEYYQKIHFSYTLKGFRNPKIKPFDVECKLIWVFQEYFYTLNRIDDHSRSEIPHQYDIFYSKDEIEKIANRCVEYVLNKIKSLDDNQSS